MYSGLLHAHSGFRWLVLGALIAATVYAILNISNRGTYKSKKIAAAAMGLTHLQIVIGIILFFISPKVQFGSSVMSNSMLRFFTVEHGLVMILAAVLITIGYSKAKRSERADRTIAIYYGLGLLLILSRIPWPGMGLGANWF